MLTKGILYGKEFREPYYRNKSYSCRGKQCDYCSKGKLHNTRVREVAATEKIKSFIDERSNYTQN